MPEIGFPIAHPTFLAISDARSHSDALRWMRQCAPLMPHAFVLACARELCYGPICDCGHGIKRIPAGMTHAFWTDTLASRKVAYLILRQRNMTSEASAGEPAASSSGSMEELQLDGNILHEDTPFISLRELQGQMPDLSLVRERYNRGEITPEEMRAALQDMRDHLRIVRERKTTFAERERRGEVTRAERQKEYGWTDEELQAIRNDIKMSGEVISQNIARCRDRSVLYRSSRGH